MRKLNETLPLKYYIPIRLFKSNVVISDVFFKIEVKEDITWTISEKSYQAGLGVFNITEGVLWES